MNLIDLLFVRVGTRARDRNRPSKRSLPGCYDRRRADGAASLRSCGQWKPPRLKSGRGRSQTRRRGSR
jgi:hypothetical protein